MKQPQRRILYFSPLRGGFQGNYEAPSQLLLNNLSYQFYRINASEISAVSDADLPEFQYENEKFKNANQIMPRKY